MTAKSAQVVNIVRARLPFEDIRLRALDVVVPSSSELARANGTSSTMQSLRRSLLSTCICTYCCLLSQSNAFRLI